MGALFLHLSCQGGSHPCTPVGHTSVVDLCCILSPYKNRITRIQSYKIAFVARACNIQRSCIRVVQWKLRNFTPMRNCCLTNNTVPSGGLGPIIGCSTLFIGPRNTCCCGPCLLRGLRGIKHRVLYQIYRTLITYLMLTRQWYCHYSIYYINIALLLQINEYN